MGRQMQFPCFLLLAAGWSTQCLSMDSSKSWFQRYLDSNWLADGLSVLALYATTCWDFTFSPALSVLCSPVVGYLASGTTIDYIMSNIEHSMVLTFETFAHPSYFFRWFKTLLVMIVLLLRERPHLNSFTRTVIVVVFSPLYHLFTDRSTFCNRQTVHSPYKVCLQCTVWWSIGKCLKTIQHSIPRGASIVRFTTSRLSRSSSVRSSQVNIGSWRKR